VARCKEERFLGSRPASLRQTEYWPTAGRRQESVSRTPAGAIGRQFRGHTCGSDSRRRCSPRTQPTARWARRSPGTAVVSGRRLQGGSLTRSGFLGARRSTASRSSTPPKARRRSRTSSARWIRPRRCSSASGTAAGPAGARATCEIPWTSRSSARRCYRRPIGFLIAPGNDVQQRRDRSVRS
jgi:hypothetical protein